METHKTISILIKRDGKVLLIKRLNRTWHGMWCIPGGHVDEGETLREAAVREGIEEVGGVDIKEGPEPVFEHDVPEGETILTEKHRHLCNNFIGIIDGEVKTGSDAGDHVWVTPEEALGMDITGWTRTVLEWILKNRS